MIKRTLIFAASLVLFTCGNQKEKVNSIDSLKVHQPDSNALRLNNKAARLIGDAPHTYDSLKSSMYDSAIIYLDQAIEIDSLYVLAYINKTQALRGKGSLEQSLEVLFKVQILRPDLAEAIMAQGFILEKMGKLELANDKYGQALEAYEKRLASNPDDPRVQSDIAFLYIFLEDKNKAIDEIQNLTLEHPGNVELKETEKLIKNFDRNKFIEEH